MRIVLKRGNDQVVTLVGLRTTDLEPVYLNAATVKATLLDAKGQPMADFSDVPMPYVSGSQGNYEWTVEADAMMLPIGSEYSLVMTARQDELDYRVLHAVSVAD